MSKQQQFVSIERVDLLNKVLHMKNDNYRLVQICVTRLEQFDFIYTFEKENYVVSLKFCANYTDTIPSIGWLYSCAFLYENEMKDLFGVIVTDMNIDFKGTLYKTSEKAPFSVVEQNSKPVKPVNPIKSENPTKKEVKHSG